MISGALNKIGREPSPTAHFWMTRLGTFNLVAFTSWTLAGTALKAHRWFLAGAAIFGTLGALLALSAPEKQMQQDRVKVEDPSELTRLSILMGGISVLGALVSYPVGRYLMTRPMALVIGAADGLSVSFGTVMLFRCATQPKSESRWSPSWLKW